MRSSGKSNSYLPTAVTDIVKKLIHLTLILALFAFARGAVAQLQIEIIDGNPSALPIAVVPFQWMEAGPPPADAVDAIVPELVENARAGLEALIAAFDDESTPYHAAPDPRRSLRFNDYDHLARTGDWSAGEEGEG